MANTWRQDISLGRGQLPLQRPSPIAACLLDPPLHHGDDIHGKKNQKKYKRCSTDELPETTDGWQ